MCAYIERETEKRLEKRTDRRIEGPLLIIFNGREVFKESRLMKFLKRFLNALSFQCSHNKITLLFISKKETEIFK